MIVDCAHYRGGQRQHEEPLSIEAAAAAAAASESRDDFIWLGVKEPTEDELSQVQDAFGLHELAVEDAGNEHQRPKIEDYEGSFFIVLKTALYDDAKEEVLFGEINVFAGPGYIVAVRHGPGSELKPARTRLEQRPELVELGPAAAVWAIIDKVVDDYAPVVAGIEDDIEEVEGEIFQDHLDSTQRIYFLKREVIEFLRAVFPLLAPLDALLQGAYFPIDEHLRGYFRDVGDHARRYDEQVNSQRELLTSILEANLALLGVKQNEVVRSISAWAAIIAVPTFIASVYGMNFEHMPELHQHWGYPAALATMGVSIVVLYRFFRRIQWL
jgi:magnesium transporter